MPRNSRQTIAPYPFTTKSLAESNWRQVVVKMSSAVTVLRYLTSKLVFTEKDFSQVEAVTLFTAFEECIRKIDREESFRRKFGFDVFTLRAVFQELDYLVSLNPKQRFEILSKKYSFYRGKMFSRRYFFAVEGQAQKLYQTFLKHRFPKTFPQKLYIGKGYGDHGTAKNKALDGSPSWQEVAMYRASEEESSESYSVDFYRDYLVHPLQTVKGSGVL